MTAGQSRFAQAQAAEAGAALESRDVSAKENPAAAPGAEAANSAAAAGRRSDCNIQRAVTRVHSPSVMSFYVRQISLPDDKQELLLARFVENGIEADQERALSHHIVI